MRTLQFPPQQHAEHRRPDNFMLETLDGSPGENLRSRRLREDLDESLDVDDAIMSGEDPALPPRYLNTHQFPDIFF